MEPGFIWFSAWAASGPSATRASAARPAAFVEVWRIWVVRWFIAVSLGGAGGATHTMLPVIRGAAIMAAPDAHRHCSAHADPGFRGFSCPRLCAVKRVRHRALARCQADATGVASA